MCRDEAIDFCEGKRNGLVRSALDNRWDAGRVELLCLPGYSYEQTLQAYLGFKHGVPLESVEFFYRKEFSYLQMDEARVAFQEGVSFEKVEFFYRKEFNSLQMHEACLAFRRGFSVDEVASFYYPECSSRQMELKRIILDMEKNSVATKRMSMF